MATAKQKLDGKVKPPKMKHIPESKGTMRKDMGKKPIIKRPTPQGGR